MRAPTFHLGGQLLGRRVPNGSDTIGIIDNKIAYHYSFFTVTNG